MKAVEGDQDWELISPLDGSVVRRVKARSLWIRILLARVETGEPYVIYIDSVNRALPPHQRLAGLHVRTSNLCAEITLPTGRDHLGRERTAVCCLSSLNLETYMEWKDEPRFIEDVMRFLDNVLQDFIDRAPNSMSKATYSAMRERSVGLGVMGFHSFLQNNMIPFESVMAKVWNRTIFKHIKAHVDAASKVLAAERGPCPDAADYGFMERFSNKTAVAPTASISIICGGQARGLSRWRRMRLRTKPCRGVSLCKNRALQSLLEQKGKNTQEVWTSIIVNEGSVQHLECLDQQEKDVFKTAFELDQRWVVEHAADRVSFIDQAQSLNIFLPADVHKRDLHQIHMQAWKKGVKSLYYCRSKSIQRPDIIAYRPRQRDGAGSAEATTGHATDYEECLACQ